MLKAIGVDFGTTNSVVALLHTDGRVVTQQFPTESGLLDVFRTVLCFWHDDTRGRQILHHAAGPQAIEAYLDDPLDTRLIMSMKTYLAQKSFVDTSRGRDAAHAAPPAQIRACAANALGSCLGCLTSKR